VAYLEGGEGCILRKIEKGNNGIFCELSDLLISLSKHKESNGTLVKVQVGNPLRDQLKSYMINLRASVASERKKL
jgi:hypothetical protein